MLVINAAHKFGPLFLGLCASIPSVLLIIIIMAFFISLLKKRYTWL